MNIKDKIKNFEFDMTVFWKMGIVCFVIIGLGNIYSTVHYWTVLDIGSKVSKIAGIFFNFLLAYFFYWMVSSNKSEEESLEVVEDVMKDNKEILKVLDKAKKGGESKND